MNRNHFIKTLLASGTGILLPNIQNLDRPEHPYSSQTFTLNYAPHFGMFQNLGGADIASQLKFIKNAGFRAVEDNEMRNRPVAQQKKIAEIMSRLDLQMGVFVAHTIGWSEPNLTSNNSSRHQQFLAEIKASIKVAKRVDARWMTVVPGHVHPHLEMAYQTANVTETLKKAAAILEPHNLIMVLEPLNPLRDHPGQFLTKTSQAYEICKSVNSPSCKILYDVYHQQITEGNLIPNIEYAWDEIAYFQVGDNPGRKEPTTGEINFRNLFAYFQRKGYSGVIGMEHGNSKPGKNGEQSVIEAYHRCDPSK